MPARRTFKYHNIHDAVKYGDVGELEAMVKDGASINEVDATKDRFTPLHWACHRGALECLHWLLWHGADTSVTTPRGWTPAHIAAIRGQDACIQALSNNGCNLNAKDGRGSTPTHMAASHGNSFTLHSILRSGVDVNAVDRAGWSAIHNASFHGRLGCLQLLVRWGGKSDETDNNGNTPAHLAAMEGNLPCLKFLIGEAQNPSQVLSARNDNGETPKMLAQHFYKDNIVEYVSNIEWERDHPEEAENLSFPAHVAAYTGDITHLRMLVENGIVNINERDDKGSTPAHKAAGNGHLDILQWLVESGANMEIVNNAGESPKDVARRFAQLAAVKLLGGEKDIMKKYRRRSDCDSDSQYDEHESERESTYGAEEGFESEEELSPPTAGNSEGTEGLQLNKKQLKEARGRSRKKLEELERLLDVAKKNYTQLGGKIAEDRRKFKEDRDMKRQRESITELEAQLDYERIRREKLEAQLDEYRREISYLGNELDKYQHHAAAYYDDDVADRRPSGTKKKSSVKRRPRSATREQGVIIRRNVNAQKRTSDFKII